MKNQFGGMINFNNNKHNIIKDKNEDFNVLNKKRKRNENQSYYNNASFKIYKSDINNVFKNDESNDIISNTDYIYIGCEDGNVKLIQLNNKSTVKNLIGYN